MLTTLQRDVEDEEGKTGKKKKGGAEGGKESDQVHYYSKNYRRFLESR
jgi:hypothetical protein